MLRLLQFVKRPALLSAIPFGKFNPYDKPKNTIDSIKLDDEFGWDRVKKIFVKDEYGSFSKELQSILNITFSGIVIGAVLGGLKTTKHTVNSFIDNNEASRFHSNTHARQELSQRVMENFLRKGGKLGAKLGLFCFMFGLITTCTTAYRGKLRIENYILGASITGFLFRMNMGIRGALVSSVLGATLGTVCGTFSVLLLSLSGVTMDEILQRQHEWTTSKDKAMEEVIKKGMAKEKPEIQKLFEETRQLSQWSKEEDVEDSKK